MTQTIEQLTARVRELEEFKANVVKECASIIKHAHKDIAKQLTASQAYAEQLREALQTFIDEHEECTDADDWMAMMCSIEAYHIADEALSTIKESEAMAQGEKK